jgi:N-acetylglucosaminyldiphosphoundecaprenol N-acetyl-beta-D-mannosaminyltransferase
VVIDPVTREQVVAAVTGTASGAGATTLTYLNAHNFLNAWRDPAHAALLADFGVVFCDGVGLLWGLRWLGIPLPERMTPPDFVDEIFARLTARGDGVFLLGDEAPVAAAMARKLEDRFPGLVRGHHHGFFPESAEDEVAGRITASGARLVLVAMGSPLQERWIRRLAPRVGGTWLAVGGLFRWLTGTERRGPRWLTDHGFEWLCRLSAQPRRTARRYLLGLPLFGLLLLRLRLFGPRPRRMDGPPQAPGPSARNHS